MIRVSILSSSNPTIQTHPSIHSLTKEADIINELFKLHGGFGGENAEKLGKAIESAIEINKALPTDISSVLNKLAAFKRSKRKVSAALSRARFQR